MSAKRSLLLTTVALIFLVWGGLAVIGVFANRMWDPNSSVWHTSDNMWVMLSVDGKLTQEEKRLNDARYAAQQRYEVPIQVIPTAWSAVIFVASFGLLFRRNWARWLFIGLMASAALGLIWVTLLFRALGMFNTSSIFDYGVLVVVFVVPGSIALWLLSPSIAAEFHNERS